MSKTILNRLGFTIVEMLATVVVASIVTMILMQILVLTVTTQIQLETKNRMMNENYIMAEKIRFNIFQLEPQEIEVMEDSSTQTVIEIRHLYDFTTNAANEIVPDYSNPVTDILIYDKVNFEILYNGVQINDPLVFITTGSAISMISIEPIVCDLDIEACTQGIIELTLVIQIALPNGDLLSPQTYVTTILV